MLFVQSHRYKLIIFSIDFSLSNLSSLYIHVVLHFRAVLLGQAHQSIQKIQVFHQNLVHLFVLLSNYLDMRQVHLKNAKKKTKKEPLVSSLCNSLLYFTFLSFAAVQARKSSWARYARKTGNTGRTCIVV